MAPCRDVAMLGPHRLVTEYNIERGPFHNRWVHPQAVAARTKKDNESKLRNFIKRWQSVKRIKVIEEWTYWAWRRRRLRDIILPAAERFYLRNSRVCMFAWKIATVQHSASIWIQRAFRGHLYGREMAHFRRYQIRHAIVLQEWWRKAYAWLLWIRRAILRNRSARLIQRIVRGFLGRCRAKHALVAHYEEEWQRIVAERERIRIRHENNAAVLLQARYRGIIARKLHDKLATEKRAKEMEEEMARQAETEETRQFRLYEQQLGEYWAEQKRLIETAEERAEYDYNAQWDLKVARLKRRWQRESVEQAEKKEQKRLARIAEDDAWSESWSLRIEVGVEEEAKRVMRLLEGAGDGSEAAKQEAKEIRAFIATKTSEIRQRFRSSGVPLSESDARIKAKQDCERTYGAAKRARMEIDMEEDRKDIQMRRLLADEEEAKRNGNLNEAKRRHALHIIQGNVRKYHARQELKNRIRFNWRKEFDPEYLCYYYKHRNNGEMRWEKPKLLGRSDLPPPSRFYHIRDQSFDPGASYWLKPMTGDMTFKKEEIGALMCHRHPNDFAEAYCCDCALLLCTDCLDGNPSRLDKDPNVPLNILPPPDDGLKKHKKHNHVMIDGGKPKESFAVPCESCGFCSAVGTCSDCGRQQYCKACFSSYHKNSDYPDYANHQLEPLSEEMQLLVQEEISRKEKERLNHAQSK